MRISSLSLALLLSSLAALPCQAQMYPFSQRGKVSQSVAFTEISIEYGRPTARGRALFGALVPWDSVWHPGADDATRISFSRDITLEGQPLKAGTYTAWLIPRASLTWTFILSRAVGVPHTPYPGRDKDALRLDVRADSASHLETMSFHFPIVTRPSSTLRTPWCPWGIPPRHKVPARP